MFCRRCGMRLPPSARFCSGCGASVHETSYAPPRMGQRPAPGAPHMPQRAYVPAPAYPAGRGAPVRVCAVPPYAPALPLKKQANIWGLLGLICSLFAALPLCIIAAVFLFAGLAAIFGIMESYLYGSMLLCIYMGVFAFVFSLFSAPAFGIVGIALSAIGLGLHSRYRLNGLAAAGLALGIVFTVISLVILSWLIVGGYAS